MLFACDIGNSRIKSGFFNKEKITEFKTFEDVDSLIKFAFNKKLTEAAISSVVPDRLKYFKRLFNSHLNFNPLVIKMFF
jgi:pantothenate kinase type III